MSTTAYAFLAFIAFIPFLGAAAAAFAAKASSQYGSMHIMRSSAGSTTAKWCPDCRETLQTAAAAADGGGGGGGGGGELLEGMAANMHVRMAP